MFLCLGYKLEEQYKYFYDRKFETSYDENKFTLIWTIEDENSHEIILENSMCVEGESFTENC